MTKIELTTGQRAEIERWIAALESGKYQQAKSVLHENIPGGGYCCLGVYAALCGANWHRTDDDVFAPFIDGEIIGGTKGDEYLVTDWFKERTGISYAGQAALATLNDNSSDFKTVASTLCKLLETGWLSAQPDESE